MKVIFLEDIPDVAMAGQVKEVKAGYARNYLLPRQLAAVATADQLQRQKKLLAAAEKRHQDQLGEARLLAEKLQGLTLTIVARVGERGKLYGSVTGADIISRIQEATGVPVDRHQLLLGQPLKEMGSYPLSIRLAPEVKVTVQVDVVGEGQGPKAAVAAAPDAAAAPESAAGPGPSAEGESQAEGLPGEGATDRE